MTLLSAIPALPVSNIETATSFYRNRLGFDVIHADAGFAVVARDQVRVHLWAANDPNMPGAEPFLAGSASCRINVTGIDALYQELTSSGVVHPNGPLATQPWGERDFSVLDQDNNCISFTEPVAT